MTGAAVGMLGLFATWRLARRLGGPLAGLCALVLLATCPLYYGHMFMNAKDAPFAVAMIVLLLGVVRALDEYPQPGPRTIVLVGVGLGLAFGSRILAAIAAPSGMAALLPILIVEHDLDLVFNIADTVTVMEQGRVVEQGTVDEIFASPKEAYTQRLLDAIPGASVDLAGR